MNVYISVDLEGIAGVNDPRMTGEGRLGYQQAAALMLGETNAAIAGAFDGGARAVVVADSHGDMINLDLNGLDPRAELISGHRPLPPVTGAGPGSFDVALYVGYHASAGTIGTLAHTYISAVLAEIRVNGRRASEAALNASLFGAWGIPVGLVAGDDVLAAEMAEWLPWAERVAVKQATGQYSARSLSAERSQALVRAGAEAAVRRVRAGELAPLVIAEPIVVDMDFLNVIHADFAALVPTVTRTGPRAIRIESPDAAEAYRAINAVLWLCTVAKPV